MRFQCFICVRHKEENEENQAFGFGLEIFSFFLFHHLYFQGESKIIVVVDWNNSCRLKF